MSKKPEISKELYSYLVNKKTLWAGFQSNIQCGLGSEKTFKVKDEELEIKVRCCQHGGTFTGYYTYVFDK